MTTIELEPLTAAKLTRPDGTVALDTLVEGLHLTKTELASVLGMSRDSLSKALRVNSQVTQSKLRDLVEILMRVTPWAGSVSQAFAWFTSQPLPSFGDQTAADLVREGRAEAVKRYLARIAVGGFA